MGIPKLSGIMSMEVTLMYSIFIFFNCVYMFDHSSSERNTLFFLAEPEEPVLDITEMNYTAVDANNKASCVVHCIRRQNCGHAVFCENSETCYLDDKGVSYCGGDYNECMCLASGSWASENESVGAWFKLYLDQPRMLGAARIMQRPYMKDRNKDVRFEFSDGSVQELPYRNQDGRFWDNLDLQEVKTSWVNITILSVYTKDNNGWKKIELFSPDY